MSTKENKYLISQFYKEWDTFCVDAAKVRSSVVLIPGYE
jgi:hypothetical protein